MAAGPGGGTAPETRRRSRRTAASLRERLVAGLGWTAAEEPVRVIASGRQRYRLRAIARHHGWTVLLCDGPGGAPLAAYATRRRIHERASRRGSRTVVVFSDPAGTEQVWAWREPLAVGAEAYREESRSGAAEDGEQRFGFVRETAAEALQSAEGREGAEAARAALLARLRRHAGIAQALAGGASAGALQELLESSRSPSVVRVVWSELEALRILDPACGSGEWLAGCLEALAAAGESCLERMRVWVDEERRSGKRARPEKLSDLKRVTRRAAALAGEGVADRFVRESVLVGCLKGAEVDRGQAEECRRRLGATLLPCPPPGGAEIELPDVAEGSLTGGIASAAALADWARRDPSAAAVARAAAAQAEALARAEHQLVRMRLRDGVSMAELVEGLRLLRGRRAVLGVALAPEAMDAPLHPWILYHGILRSRGFDLVRGHAPSAYPPTGAGAAP